MEFYILKVMCIGYTYHKRMEEEVCQTSKMAYKEKKIVFIGIFGTQKLMRVKFPGIIETRSCTNKKDIKKNEIEKIIRLKDKVINGQFLRHG